MPFFYYIIGEKALSISMRRNNSYFQSMDIKILAVGKIRDAAYSQKTAEYAGRIRHDAKLEIVEIRDAGLEGEAEKIIDHCRRERAEVYALDERGKLYTSPGFARSLGAASRRIIFIVGGPDGLSDRVKKTVRGCIALSPMTFTHEMARLLLLEQLYRAISILKGRKYNK
jgi:23S rRNA (pseudouridine1915-N3)-methyltransferase